MPEYFIDPHTIDKHPSEQEKYQIVRPNKPVPVYLRFGLFAGMRRSINHHTGEYEKGLSVYRAKLINGIVDLDQQTTGDELLRDRLCFAVTGREVGIGSDGEPVIVAVKLVPYPISMNVRREYPDAAPTARKE